MYYWLVAGAFTKFLVSVSLPPDLPAALMGIFICAGRLFFSYQVI
jgi:hypothetical protein